MTTGRKNSIYGVCLLTLKRSVKVQLDKLYVKTESAFYAFENFSHFRRPSNMSIKDYMVDFNLIPCKIRSHAMDLPEGVLAY